MRYAASIILLSASVAATPLRADPPSASSGAQAAVGDPNERVCEDIIQTGSRIAAKRYCATRAEWADKKKQDREAVEKAQMSPCVLTHNGGNGKPGC